MTYGVQAAERVNDFSVALVFSTSALETERPFVVNLRVSLVEDNLTIRISLMDMLTDLVDARMVGIAEQQADAVQWLNEHSDEWDVAIVDIFLKRGSGLPVLTACARRSPKQRVLVLSNYATPEIRTRA
ncbi:response regulator receiver domain protein, CheY family [Rhodoferax antarcticus ANT.BR]|uniref:Response regulator receiver domain protein, CheY family n=1 Tax=Rhodoferax antarcticus ANT.BR TaxID=1111071 RepID=A0A1Q8YIE6_9BURK|nr:response regulator receiver domain protein, CheY family [Rhodoferax antarcticus ANT.BR]